MLIRVISTTMCALALWAGLHQNVIAVTPLRDLGEYGPTQSVSRYVDRYQISRSKNKHEAMVKRVVQPTRRYPILSPGVTPGVVTSQEARFPALHVPLCVVGFDQVSYDWIQQYLGIMQRANAACIITNVATAEEHSAVEQWLGSLPSFAASATDILSLYNIQHYPVLLSRFAIEQ